MDPRTDNSANPATYPASRWLSNRLLTIATSVFLLAWAVTWLPVLLTGTGASLFLWPLTSLLAMSAWVVALVALIVGVVRRERPCGARSAWRTVWVLALLVIGPAAFWLVPVQGAVG